jgi:arylsulfatase A-like enzyme
MSSSPTSRWARPGGGARREREAAEHRVLLWGNLGWGEVGCYGGGVLRGAPTPRIDNLAADGSKLLNFNVEAQCTPSRSALLTGRHPIRSGTQTVPLTGGPDGLTRWEVTIAQALSEAGYATGMWGKWHLGRDTGDAVSADALAW